MGQRQSHGREVLGKLKSRLRDPRKRLADAWIHLDELQQRLCRLMRLALHNHRMVLGTKINALQIHSPRGVMISRRQNLEFQTTSLVRAIKSRIRGFQTRLILLEKGLGDLNPTAILNRGYSIALHLPEKRVLKRASGMHRGDQIMVLLGEGRLKCRVETAEPDSRFPFPKKV